MVVYVCSPQASATPAPRCASMAAWWMIFSESPLCRGAPSPAAFLGAKKRKMLKNSRKVAQSEQEHVFPELMIFVLSISCGVNVSVTKLAFLFRRGGRGALAVLCLWVDIRVFGNDIPEVSLTEVVQESVLAVIVLVHLLLARKYAHLRYSNILIGGFFLAMLIRELDGLFDLLSHGSWVWFALLATAGSLVLPLRHLRQTLSQLAEYTRTPYYGMMISGLLAILVFSRLFGMHGLWYAVLEENYARVVKNTVEEGSESFGYMLCLTATLGYACYFRGLRDSAVAAALTVDDSHRRTYLPAVARRRG